MVIAPYNITELNRTPYVTAVEVKSSAIAASLDFGSLIPRGGGVDNIRALNELIVSASIEADNFVFGPLGTMGASVNNESGEFRPDPVGMFKIVPYYKPILEVRSFSISAPGTSGMPVTITPENCKIYRNYFTVMSGWSATGITVTNLSQLLSSGSPPDQLLNCQYTYVNGFANTFLSAAVVEGAVTLPVQSSVGIYPGAAYPIWDGTNNETVQVASTYDGVSLSVPLVSGLLYGHAEGTNVSQIPKTVKDAVIHLVCASVRQRGSGALVISEIGFGAVSKSGSGSDNDGDKAAAWDLLDDFKNLWGQR